MSSLVYLHRFTRRMPASLAVWSRVCRFARPFAGIGRMILVGRGQVLALPQVIAAIVVCMAVAAPVAATPATSIAGDASVPPPRRDDPHASAVALYGQVLDLVRKNYVGPVDEQALTVTALKAVLSSLDPHSTYMTPDEYHRNFETFARSGFGGIGAELRTGSKGPVVAAVVDGTPSARAGIKPGWRIETIDGVAALGMSVADAVQRLRGEPGSIAAVTFRDLADQPVQMRLERQVLHFQTVYQRRIGDYGYLRIAAFSQATPADFREAEAKLLATGSLKGLILDLRNNAGGFVDATVDIAARFLPPGTVVYRTGKSAATAIPIKTTLANPPFTALPLVVLINSATTSAAEILAAALHDNRHALLVGLPTFGKGLVQTVFALGGGANGAISLTTMRDYTPAGEAIQKVGIMPDLLVARTARQAREIVTGQALRSEATLANSPDNEMKRVSAPVVTVEGPPSASPADDRSLFAQPLVSDDDIATDFQIRRALDVLDVGGIPAARTQRPALLFTAHTPAHPGSGKHS